MASNDAELADAAEDSIEQINATDDAETSQSSVDSKLTLEERKKKMEQLRSKMVRCSSLSFGYSSLGL